MYCKLCHKHVRSISHWTREHRAYLRKRAKAGGRKRGSKRSSGGGGSGGKSHYCPHCGKKHR